MQVTHYRNRKRKNKIRLFVTGLLLFLLAYLALNGINVGNNSRETLDPETLKSVKRDIEAKIDSILKDTATKMPLELQSPTKQPQ